MTSRKKPAQTLLAPEEYFRVGVADDFILIRADFPVERFSPGDFARLLREMFRRNDEVLSHGK